MTMQTASPLIIFDSTVTQVTVVPLDIGLAKSTGKDYQ